MFLNSMFSQMTTGVKGEGPFGDTTGTGVWRSMLTDEYSKTSPRPAASAFPTTSSAR